MLALVGVYDADGTVIGEITYWLGARIGRAHCSLCDVTHGVFRERDSWRRWRQSLEVPFELFHRDDAPTDVLAAAPNLPAAMARTSDGVELLLDRTALDRCAGDLPSFALECAAALSAAGLHVPW